MTDQPRVPLGPAIPFTEDELAEIARVQPLDIIQARNLWIQQATLKALPDAVTEEAKKLDELTPESPG